MNIDEMPRVWVPDGDWMVLEPDDERRCRYRKCGKPAVAVLYRGHADELPRPWAYCSEHLYGRQIIRGVVHVQVCADSISSRRGYAGNFIYRGNR